MLKGCWYKGEYFESLFLDRDGVINRHIIGDYVRTWDDFEFLPGVKEALKIFSGCFRHIFVVTNQRGVGKGLMTENDLEDIHGNMVYEIEKAGGRIDKIYFCADTDEGSINRKPNPGMALKAKEDFPEVDFTKSIMIGDGISDMDFGKSLNMKTILINNDNNLDGLLKFAINLTADSKNED